MLKKRSFLERLSGSIRMQDDEEEEVNDSSSSLARRINLDEKRKPRKLAVNEEEEEGSKWEEEQEAELTVDLYQTPSDIIVQTMVAGVLPENLSITITRDMITIKGKREENQSVSSENFYVQELYWGAFGRTISLPEEVDPEEAEAIEKHGLLIIRLPKLDKNRETKLKIKSI